MENNQYDTLKRTSQFLQLKSRGKFIRASSWLVVNYARNERGFIRPGWTVSRKVGNAVVRNRLKRWCREFVRKQKRNGFDINLIFKSQPKGFFQNLSHEDFDKVLAHSFITIEKRI